MKTLLLILVGILAPTILLALVIPKARKGFLGNFLYIKNLWGIVEDYAPGKRKIISVWLFLFVLVLVILLTVLLTAFILVVGPAYSIYMGIKYPDSVDRRIHFGKDLHAPSPVVPKKTPEETMAADTARYDQVMAVRFTIDRKDLLYDPDENEVIFYTPEREWKVEDAIFSKYSEINNVFKQYGYSFVFLPHFNKELNGLLKADRMHYYNPKSSNRLQIPVEDITYKDIREALNFPDNIDGPCFIRCGRESNNTFVVSVWKISLSDGGGIVPYVEEYLKIVDADGPRYFLVPDEDIRHYAEGKPADERFDTDIYLIRKEIQDRIAKLRAKGLSTLAIRKLIGDDSDQPGKLFIDKHNKVYLTDYGNKEIKMEPLQKAVFFLFLRHPEGIYFKDLSDYRDELGAIYKEITGRDDIAGIESSISRLTDPLNNSINEKCARIKNAFVSEFREEVAQWYFINGTKGEKKTIKLPRELVTWEIKD